MKLPKLTRGRAGVGLAGIGLLVAAWGGHRILNSGSFYAGHLEDSVNAVYDDRRTESSEHQLKAQAQYVREGLYGIGIGFGMLATGVLIGAAGTKEALMRREEKNLQSYSRIGPRRAGHLLDSYEPRRK